MAEDQEGAEAAAEDQQAQEALAEAVSGGGDEPEDGAKKALNAERRARRESDRELKSLRAKLKEFEDRDKSESEKLNEQLTAAQQRALEADKLDAALEKAPEGMSMQQVRKLARRISGGTREEMEADAADLFAEFATTRPAAASGHRPVDGLRSGSLPAGDSNQVDPNTWLRRQAGRK